MRFITRSVVSLCLACGLSVTAGCDGESSTPSSSAAAPASGAAAPASPVDTEKAAMKSQGEIAMAIILYQNSNRGRGPDTLAELVGASMLRPDQLVSPYGSVSDGKGDYWVLPKASQRLGAENVIVYDRASYAKSDKVAVSFGDGHSELIAKDKLLQGIMLAQPSQPNTPIDPMLPASP